MNTSQNCQPKIVVNHDPSIAVAESISLAIQANPTIVLGLATGGTPVGVYRELVRMHKEDGLDFSKVTTFNLDEYIGLGGNHPQSFRHFMQQQLFDHVNLQPSRTHVPDGLASDVAVHAAQYEQQIKDAGGIDLQLLGIGGNGHIAFNEPGSTVDCRTREIELTPATIEANARFFDSPNEVPRRAITMGIGTILEAKTIVLMAIGSSKATAVTRAIEGEADASHPASLLQAHTDVTFALDEAAAAKLTREM